MTGTTSYILSKHAAKVYTDTVVADLSIGSFTYKGTVPTKEDLPSSASNGDMYATQNNEGTFVWENGAWYAAGGKGDKGDKGDSGLGDTWGFIEGNIYDQKDLGLILDEKLFAGEETTPGTIINNADTLGNRPASSFLSSDRSQSLTDEQIR